MELCTYSKSRTMRRLSECPLGLSEAKSKKCVCRQRRFVQDELRILSCTFPNDWQGNPVTATKVEIDMSEAKEKEETLFGEVNGSPLRIPVIGLVGGKGSGKTFTGSSLLPEETTEIAVEDSGVTFNFPFAKRYSMYKEVKTESKDGIPSPLECWLWFIEILPKIDTRILFIDPITDLQAGAYQYVEANCGQFRLTESQCRNSSGLVWGAVKSYLKIMLGTTGSKVETLIYTSHLGTVWRDGKPVSGKVKAKGVDTFYEIASLVVYLNRDSDPMTGKQPEIPVGLITPPLGKQRLAVTHKKPDGSYGGVTILPPRIPKFDWTNVRKYVANPPDYSKLKAGEKDVARELTEKEKLELHAQIASDQKDAEEIKTLRQAVAAAAAKRNAAAKSGNKNKQAATEDEKPQDDKTQADTAPFDLPREEVLPLVKDQFRQLGLNKEQCQKAIAKRGGDGAKLADLTDDQLEGLRKALWSKLTQRDIAKK